jgi:hypothetical protein
MSASVARSGARGRVAVSGGMPFFQYLGNYEAKATTVFPILAQSPEVAVLRIYGEYLLTVPFNRDPNGAVFENKLLIVKMSDKTPLSLEKVGPLRAKSPETTPRQP